MEIGNLASALMAGRAAELQLAVAARLLRMHAQTDASAARLLDAAQQNAAQVAAGIGGTLDVIV